MRALGLHRRTCAASPPLLPLRCPSSQVLTACGTQHQRRHQGHYTERIHTLDKEKMRMIDEDLGLVPSRRSRGSRGSGVQTLTTERDGSPAGAHAEAVGDVIVVGSDPEGIHISSARRDNPVMEFLEAQENLLEEAQLRENEQLPLPEDPKALIPQFTRVKNSQKIVVLFQDLVPEFHHRNQFPKLPPPQEHPWVETVMGPHVVHGDGQLGVVGTGEVGFEDGSVHSEAPKHWRGLTHSSVVGRQLPLKNGTTLQDAVVKHSLSLTGRGVFATKDIKEGDIIMIVSSTACNVGFNDELSRLCAMTTEILLAAYNGGEEERDFLHTWILNGQLSNLINHFPAQGVKRVMADIGGQHVLDALELHPIHIARIAAIIDLNSMVVESSYGERRGAAYWPEAALLNHSCAPNATYDIMPEHVFQESTYFQRVAGETLDDGDGDAEAAPDAQEGGAAGSATASGSGSGSSRNPDASPAQCSTCCGGNHHHHHHHNEQRRSDRASAAAPASESSSVADQSSALVGVRGATHMDESETPSSAASSSSSSSAHDAALQSQQLLGAPGNYLFCCKATRDIAAGEEILISYVPVEWNFDSRQVVLHERYKFWCKCQRCAPSIDSIQARIPKFSVFLIFVFVGMQLLVYRARAQAMATTDEDFITPLDDSETRGLVDLDSLERRRVEAANRAIASQLTSPTSSA